MRPIKFRAWNDESKTMYSPSRNMLIEAYDGSPVWQFGFELPMPMEVELMQFTGLQDIDGNDIYEGDIIQKIGYSKSFVVKWRNGKNGVGFNISPAQTGRELSLRTSSKIIGNIHENPELINA